MKLVTINDASGKPVKITMLTSVDLLYCIPYTLLSFLHRISRIATYLVFRLLVSPSLWLFKTYNLSLTWAIVLFPLMIAVASAATTVAGSFSVADLVGATMLFMLGATLHGAVFSIYYHLEDKRFKPEGRLSPREAAMVARVRTEAGLLPDGCVHNERDKPILYVGFLRTMLIVPALICALLLSASWLSCALTVYVALFIFNDFETIEHIASHATGGQLLIVKKAPWWARSTEFLRRYLVWPLFGWFPNMYFVTHAMHHHVENNGSADWQSTIRYDRSSIFDFSKVVTWMGVNMLLPFETLSYLIQKRRFRLVKMLIRGFAVYALLLTILALSNLPLLIVLSMEVLLGGFGMFRFVGIWHGFHDPAHQCNVQAANQNLFHYAHHAQRRIHLRDFDGLGQVVRELGATSQITVLRPEYESRSSFWRLQGLLWRKDFARAADCLVEHRSLAPNDMASTPFNVRSGLAGCGISTEKMRSLTSSFIQDDRSTWIKCVDETLSKAIGTLVSPRSARAAAPTHSDAPRATEQRES